MSIPVKKKYNFGSPRTILTACDFEQLSDWCMEEAKAIPERPILDALKLVLRNFGTFVRRPQKTMLLLWEEETRQT